MSFGLVFFVQLLKHKILQKTFGLVLYTFKQPMLNLLFPSLLCMTHNHHMDQSCLWHTKALHHSCWHPTFS